MNTPFIKLVQSPNAYYFYDVNKNQIVRIQERTYCILENMLQGKDMEPDADIERLQRMGFLSDHHVIKIEHPDTEILPDILKTKLKSLVLQVTQRCNLRCQYCVYSEKSNELQRSHSAKSMDVTTAEKAIDFFALHACETQLPSVAFYGGEPLLEFEKMTQMIAYAREKMYGQKIRFTFTTNGILLTPDIVDYLYKNEIYFLLSLDGLESVHDKNRRDVNGEGSYARIRENMSYIKEHYPDYFNKLAINSVLDQKNDYDEIISMYEDSLWGNVQGYYSSYIEELDLNKSAVFTDDFQKKEIYHRFLAYVEYLKTGTYSGRDALAAQDVKGLEKLKNGTFEKRAGLPETGAPAGPCVPGQLKLFVNVDGDFFPCERVSELSECMKIGNVNIGIDMKAVERMLNIGKLTEENCRRCWAFSHCGMCVRQADGGRQLSAAARLDGCKGARYGAEQKIRDYIMLKEYGKGL